MGWLTSLPTEVLISKRSVVETVYQYANSMTNQRYSTRSLTTTVVEYRSLTQSVAETQAGSMPSDTTAGSGTRTVVTADVKRQNEADGYAIEKTTAVTTAWSAWSAWDPPL